MKDKKMRCNVQFSTRASSWNIAFLALLAVAGCQGGTNQIVTDDPTGSAPADIVVPASRQTTAATGITRWELGRTAQGGWQTRGLAAGALVFLLDAPRYTAHDVGSFAVEVRDDTGRMEQGLVTVRDGKRVGLSLPAQTGNLAKALSNDLAHRAVPYTWDDCNAAKATMADLMNDLATANANVSSAMAAVDSACVVPDSQACADAHEQLDEANDAADAVASAIGIVVDLVHRECDNLCTSDAFCSIIFGTGWTCGGDGECAAPTTCPPACLAVACGWDYSCGSAVYCGSCDCGSGGGSGC
jgi:hypothetical protein